jgi:hypothetical protein
MSLSGTVRRLGAINGMPSPPDRKARRASARPVERWSIRQKYGFATTLELVPKSTDDDADDGSTDRPHADDRRTGFSDNGVWNAQQQSKA